MDQLSSLTQAWLPTIPEQQPTFSITDIPFILFEEMSRVLGLGEEDKHETPMDAPSNPENFVRWRKLDKDNPLVGFHGLIRLHGFGTQLYFDLYSSSHADTQRLWEDRSDPIITVEGGITNMTKNPWHRVKMRNMDFSSPAMKMVGMVIVRAHQLATDPRCADQPYWT